MRLLFVMGYPGYLRYFDGTIKLLRERGHEVHLAFDRPDYQAEGLKALERMGEGVVLLDPPPRRKDIYGPFARGLRAAVDYARYLDPRFEHAHYLRTRRKKALELTQHFAFLAQWPMQTRRRAQLLIRALLTLETAIPSSEQVEDFLRSVDPDLVIVSPLISQASPQTDVVKSARSLGIPSVLCVASWDHLTTKGLIRAIPERIAVWNEVQRREAIELHNVPESRIAVTGAQPFDRWFGREPTRKRKAFCARVGLPDERPFLLFVGSTAGISRPDAEEAFVRAWIQALRSSDDPALRDIGVLIRPHPYNPGHWGQADLSGLGPVAVWPRAGANPVDEDDRADYFDSLFHSAAVVGVNTSAMIEAAIIGRPVHTVRAAEFADTQGGTLHFHYLLPEQGGFVRSAATLDEHVAQLAETLANPAAAREQLDRFIGSFVRPRGRDRAATPFLVEAIEDAAGLPVERPGGRLLRLPLRLVVSVLAMSANRPGVARSLDARSRKTTESIEHLAVRAEPHSRRTAAALRWLRRKLRRRSRTIVLWLRSDNGRGVARRKAAKRQESNEVAVSVGAAQEGID